MPRIRKVIVLEAGQVLFQSFRHYSEWDRARVTRLFKRGKGLYWRTFRNEELRLYHSYEMETLAAECGFLPTEVFMHYVIFAILRIGTHNEFLI